MKKILLLLLIPLLWPLIQPGFWVSDDGTWMVIRLAGFYDTLVQGQFPVRFIYSLNHGYGYPVTNFLYPLPFYIGSLIHFLGFSFVDSVKILFGLSVVLSAGFMYLFIKDEWGEKAGLVAAVLYSYAPYKIFDLYTRGSLGEMVAFVFVPLIFYFLNKKKIGPAALSMATLICSHNVLAFLFLPIIILYLFFNKYPWRLNTVFLILASSISAWFWFPALYDLRFTKAGSIAISDFRDYWITGSNFWQVLGIIIPLVIVTSMIRINKNHILLAGFTLISLFLALPVSESIWQILPLPRLVQFPWRFLAVTAFGSSVLAGYLFKNANKYLLAGFIVLVVLLSLPLIKIDRVFYPDSYYSTNDDTTTVRNEYMPKWVNSVISQKSLVKSQKFGENQTEIFTVYFPGIKVIADGKELGVRPSERGLLSVNSQSDNFRVSFSETWPRLIADLISILGIILLFLV